MNNKKCLGQQVNRRQPDFFCAKDQGHSGGHLDPQSKKVWGTPRRPYGVRSTKASVRRKVRG